MVNPVIEESWKRELADQFAAPYFEELKRFLIAEKQQFPVYPIAEPPQHIYRSLQ